MYMSGIVNIEYKSAGQSMENLPHNVRSPVSTKLSGLQVKVQVINAM